MSKSDFFVKPVLMFIFQVGSTPDSYFHIKVSIEQPACGPVCDEIIKRKKNPGQTVKCVASQAK